VTSALRGSPVALAAAIVVATGLGALGALGASPAGYWLQGQPRDPAEELLHDAASGTGPRTDELKAVSAAQPATLASGLAQLEAGLRLMSDRRSAEAIPFLQHPDVARTHLSDYALFGLGEAYASTGDPSRAAASHRSILEQYPASTLRCAAMLDAGDAEAASGRSDKGIELLEQALRDCPDSAPATLAALGAMRRGRKELKEAAEAYARLDREFPATPEAAAAETALRALKAYAPPLAAWEQRARELDKARRLMAAGKNAQAIPLLRSLLTRAAKGEETDDVRLRLGRALVATNRDREALTVLSGIPADVRLGAEAAYERARILSRQQRSPAPYQAVVDRYPTTIWAEDSLLALAYFYLRDLKDDPAVPYLRRLLDGFPQGRYADRSTWWIGWWHWRHGRHAEVAEMFERAARTHPPTYYTPGFLYWAGRAREALGEKDRANERYAEAVRRYKHSYHGEKAAQALQLVEEGASSTHPAPPLEVTSPGEIPEPVFSRVRELLLIGRLEEAADELKRAPASAPQRATLAWIDWRLGNYRSAIVGMQRAYPEYVSEAGDSLPPGLWQVLYPLDYGDLIVSRAREEGLDPSLVAALIWQESAFDPSALSIQGARGLMQIMPPTGRTVSRKMGSGVGRTTARQRVSTPNLYDPPTALTLGTHYLRQMVDLFGGRVERALAAYNAGPARVQSWQAARPQMTAEEFVESIPFVETRAYVMNVLEHQEQYRRLYALGPSPAGAEKATSSP